MPFPDRPLKAGGLHSRPQPWASRSPFAPVTLVELKSPTPCRRHRAPPTSLFRVWVEYTGRSGPPATRLRAATRLLPCMPRAVGSQSGAAPCAPRHHPARPVRPMRPYGYERCLAPSHAGPADARVSRASLRPRQWPKYSTCLPAASGRVAGSPRAPTRAGRPRPAEVPSHVACC